MIAPRAVWSLIAFIARGVRSKTFSVRGQRGRVGDTVQRENDMPVAVVTSEPVRKDLKSLPEGYVVIREMTYGEKIYRSGMTGAMKLLKETKSDYIGEMSMETQKITIWDFANLVVEHNLQDVDGRELNFKNEQDVRKLSAKIGDEVGTYIDEINSFQDIDEGN
jgi:hypothetical protein